MIEGRRLIGNKEGKEKRKEMGVKQKMADTIRLKEMTVIKPIIELKDYVPRNTC